jgi:hypothetical protein
MILEKWLQNAKLSKTNLPLKINEFLSNKIKLVCDITKREVLTNTKPLSSSCYIKKIGEVSKKQGC